MATEKRLMCVDDFKKNLCHYCNTYMSEEPCEPGECWVHDVIAQTGTVDAVEVVHGEWRFGEIGLLGASVKCSNCGFGAENVDPILWMDYPGHQFCGACGAKMDGGNEDA